MGFANEKEKIRSIYGVLDKFVDALYVISAGATGLLLALLFIQVFLRYVANSPVYGIDETVILLMVWAMAIGNAVVYWQNEHAVIECFLHRLPFLVKKTVLHATNVLVITVSVVYITGGITLFNMQIKTIPMGGLPFAKAYYYAFPVIVMGILLFVLSAFKTIAYIVTEDAALFTPKQTVCEGAAN